METGTLYERAVKRVLDLALALPAALVLLPVVTVVALLIWIEDRHSPIFCQLRVGGRGRLFTLFKFRTMPPQTVEVPSIEAAKLSVTRIGKVLRRTNLDEIPQLLNIVLGDMSVVGPRPALPSQGVLLGRRRSNGSFRLRPGLTGLAQIHSYDGMDELEKARWDGQYAADIGLAVDLSIILRTFGYLTKRPPVY